MEIAMTRACLLVLLLSCVLTGPAAGQSSVLSLSDVQAAYGALNGLQASFTQIVGSDFADGSTRVEGTVLLSGNKYRVRTPDQTVVTNGQATWIYTPADSQVVVSTADTEGTVTPETFLTASEGRYDVTGSTTATRLGASHQKLSLSATGTAARFAEATLWVRATDRVVTRIRATDRNGSTLDLRLHDIVVNPEALRVDAPFTFTPPPGVEVVDLRRSE
jgi:outer membrane lipoprotein carrier protein